MRRLNRPRTTGVHVERSGDAVDSLLRDRRRRSDLGFAGPLSVGLASRSYR
jgi:hypothetical protein